MPVKPSEKEEEYFARLEFEEKKKREKERIAKLEADEKKRLKELHHLHCPKCGMQLIEINYNKVASGKYPNLNIPLHPGDTIVVP